MAVAGTPSTGEFDRHGPAENIRIVKTAVRGLAKTDGDDIAEREWRANQARRGSRRPGARARYSSP